MIETTSLINRNEIDYIDEEICQREEIRSSKIISFRKKWSLGIIYIVLVAVIWTFASVLDLLAQFIFHNSGFDKPFFLTYVANSLFAINMPIYWFFHSINGRSKLEKIWDLKMIKKTFRVSAIICPLWFIANYSYNQSLNMTSVTSSTVVSSTSTIFTFLLSLLMLKEPFSTLKLIGVLLCMIGNIVTVVKDRTGEHSSNESALGDLIALFSAFMYGIYTTAIRKYIPNGDSIDLLLFFGLLGLINMISLAPLVYLFNFTGVESLSNLTWSILGLLLIKGLFDNVLSDYLWARAVLLTSPTVATVGLSLTIPFAIISDLVFHGTVPQLLTILASMLVIIGFILINTASMDKPS